jgi:hypothetical protein
MAPQSILDHGEPVSERLTFNLALDLDGKHFVYGEANDNNGRYGIFFFPCAAQGIYEQGQYYHIAVMFTDRTALDDLAEKRFRNMGSSDAEYTRRGVYAEHAKEVLTAFHLPPGWERNIRWEYTPCPEGFNENPFAGVKK